MMPLLTYPVAMVALVSLPILAGIYLLRNRHRRRPVSSLMLWRLPARTREAGPKVDRLQLPPVFFLELLILLLLVGGAIGPRWQLSSTLHPLIIVLDDSASMLAGVPEACPRALATQALRRLLEEHRVRSLRAVFAGVQPRQAAAPADSRAFLDHILGQWTCREPEGGLDAALLLAAELGRDDAEILVLTDRPPVEGWKGTSHVRWWAFGKAQPNVAFVNARRTLHGDLDRCLLELANPSPNPQSVKVQFNLPGQRLEPSEVRLAPQATQRVTLSLPAGSGNLEAWIGSDALDADNRVWLAPPKRHRVRTQLHLTDNSLRTQVRHALEASGLCVVVDQRPELLIHQGSNAVTHAEAWELRLLQPTPAIPFTGPFLLDHAHPLVAGLDLDGVIWGAASTNAAPGAPVISAGNTPLLSAWEDALGRQHLVLQLAPEMSTLPSAPAFPVLIWNLLQWRISALPGLRECNVRLGEEVECVTRDPRVRITNPESAQREVEVRANPLIVRPSRPGLHTIVTADSNHEFSVNFLSAAESDLQRCGTGRWGEWSDARSAQYEYTFAARLLLLLALVGLWLHQWLLANSRVRV